MKKIEILTIDEVLEKYGDVLTPYQIEKLEYFRVDNSGTLKIQITDDGTPDVDHPIHYLTYSGYGGGRYA